MTVDSAHRCEVLDAVRTMLVAEVDRAADPARHDLGSDPTDHDGWTPFRPGDSREQPFGQPYFTPQSWTYFALVDVAILVDSIWVGFGWTDPETPSINYHARIGVPDLDAASPAVTAARCRTYLRVLLAPEDPVRIAPTNSAPGWRNRVTRTWLDRDNVLVSIPAFPDYPNPSENQEAFDDRWHSRG